MMGWFKKLHTAFGASFLWLVCLIYFTQGFRSFVWTAVSYQLKDNLKLSPSASQFVTSIAFFPWSIKPLYGILSDCFPIRGRKRVPYLTLATLLSLLPWLILGLSAFLRNTRVELMILLTVQNLGSAMADVVIDAMIAEAVRFERASFAGDLQSVSWLSMAFGGICGSLLGGYALNNLQIDGIFLLFSVFPALQLFSCGLVGEVSVQGKAFPEGSAFNGSDMMSGIIDEEKFSGEKSKISTLRRKKSQKNTKEAPTTENKFQAPDKNGSSLSPWYQSLKMATYTLFRAFRQPAILRPMAWFFLAHVTVPNISTVMFYYQTEFLKLEASFLGTARVLGWLSLMIGTLTYNRYLKKMKLRHILMFTQVGVALLTVLDMVLVSRANVLLGISDKVTVLFGSALSDGINQFKFMPFLILSGQLCPPGVEGTLFALFMSINNLGSTVGSFVGAGLASVLNISSGSFDNLFLGIGIQGEDIIAILPWEEWWEFELTKDDSNPHIALLPLHPDFRAKFNQTAAWEYARSMAGKPYGFHNLIFSWIDTIDGNHPSPLDAHLVASVMTVWNHLQPAYAANMWNEALNKRLGTQGLDLPDVLVEVEKRGSSFAKLLTIPEQDDWVYSDGKSTSCIAFVLEMYKEAGLFGPLASSIQVTEFTIKDAYSLKFFENNTNRLPKWCNADDTVKLPFCQIRGMYRMELPGYNTMDIYAHMTEKCPSMPPKYYRPQSC